jgi:hypothetical protein
VLAVLPFAPSLGGAFVYDDHALIEERSAIHSLARLPELWRGEFWQGLTPVHFRYLRPVVSTSYALDWALYGGAPAGFHLTNLLLHGSVAWLLFCAMRRWAPGSATSGALAATVAWAWHPSKVEAVSWIAGRTDLLCALGILIACAGVHRRLSNAADTGRRAGGVLLEIAGLVLAFGSKESAVVLPAFVMVEAWTFSNGASLRQGLGRAFQTAVPYVALTVAYIIARAAFLPIIPDGAGTISFVDARLYTLETFGEFARVVLWPVTASIQRAPIRVDAAMRVLHDPVRLATGVVTAVLFAWGMVRTWPGAAWRRVGWLLGIAALSPVSNLVSARMIFLFAERFAYVPLMGFALFAIPEPRPRRWTPALWALALGASFALSTAHTRHFLDDRSLWSHELAVNPKDPLALRYACEEAMRRHDDREAQALAVRGYEAAAGWPVPRPDRIEFAARAARSLELVTLDRDAATLKTIVDFYRTFFDERGAARIESLGIDVDAGGAEAKSFRRTDPARLATMKLWAAIASSRLGQCDFAEPMVRAYLSAPGETPGRVSAALVLARCGAWDEALDVARSLDARSPIMGELAQNLDWARSIDREDHASLEGALRWSRAQTLLLDRGRAFAALVPWQREVLADRDAAIYYARTAWAAGRDESAREALASHMNEREAATLLASWSRELGRE